MSASSSRNIVVLASGRGSNFRALCLAAASGRLSAKVSGLICNVPEAGCVGIARELGIPAFVIESAGKSRSEHEALVRERLSRLDFGWIALAGYMRLLSPELIRAYWDEKAGAARILNIHPSLLPAFPGRDGYAQALAHGVKVTGVTVHLVGAGLDDGPIVAQEALSVRDDDTLESLESRGLELEHQVYADAIRDLVTREWSVGPGPITGGCPRVRFRGGAR